MRLGRTILVPGGLFQRHISLDTIGDKHLIQEGDKSLGNFSRGEGQHCAVGSDDDQIRRPSVNSFHNRQE